MSEFETRYEKLNPQQKKAVDHIEGPLLVVAGPGTGKTEILGLRTANILRKTFASPGNILCLTFTNAAAFNMRKRLTGLIGRDAYRVAIHTFHSFGVEIIGSYPEFFHRGTRFHPLDDVTRIEILEDILSSLPHGNPLSPSHPDEGYVYLKSAVKAFSDLKKAGLSPGDFRKVVEQNEKSYEVINPLIESVFSARVTRGMISGIRRILVELGTGIAEPPVPGVSPIISTLKDSLQELADFLLVGETAPVSDWKRKNTARTDDKRLIFKSAGNTDKLKALADIYEEYQQRLYDLTYYDFDDMILWVIEAIEKNPRLAHDLRDRYEYILVDEFQDTNGAQMKLLRLLAGRGKDGKGPNVMAVGDDDQAIYKFQGAEIANILGFRKAYPGAKILTIASNYRSTRDVLGVAEYVIKGAKGRLVNLERDLNKSIESANENISPGKILSRSFASPLHENTYVAREIKRLLDGGKPPGEIAVIARRHDCLKGIADTLGSLGVPLTYERFNNVLDEPHVRQLIRMAEFVSTLGRKGKYDADELLPEILSYPFWDLKRKTVWEISRAASGGGAGKELFWLDVMQKHENPDIRRIADFFIYVGEVSMHDTLERVLDLLMGADPAQAPADEDDDSEPGPRAKERFVSPFKKFYFGEQKLKENRLEYTRFLSCLRTFVESLRDYKKTKVLGVDDLASFVRLHRDNNIPVIDNSVFINAESAVSLLTAHNAKGLEFDTVFIIACQHDIWAGGGRGSNLQFPPNLPITPSGEDLDDQIRLFYVALTRARSSLYLTSYERKENGRESSRLGFIAPPVKYEEKDDERLSVFASSDNDRDEKIPSMFVCPAVAEEELPDNAEVLAASWESFHRLPVIHSEKAILEPILNEYKLSVTHLNNFLNVTDRGPQLFFEQNLLRFPQAKSAAGSYGTAVHKVLQETYLHIRRHDGAPPALEELLGIFDAVLKAERMSERDYMNYSRRGRDMLTVFFDMKMSGFLPGHLSEVNFSGQGVVVGDARLTGKIDKMITSGGEAVVYDYKTGKAKPDWKGRSQDESVRMHQYRNQLIFYKILVEHSRDYAEYKVNRGVLEFVEHANGVLVDLPLDISMEDYERMLRLAAIVYNKIMTLDFPDVSKYSKDLKGILKFEDDLLEGKI